MCCALGVCDGTRAALHARKVCTLRCGKQLSGSWQEGQLDDGSRHMLLPLCGSLWRAKVCRMLQVPGLWRPVTQTQHIIGKTLCSRVYIYVVWRHWTTQLM